MQLKSFHVNVGQKRLPKRCRLVSSFKNEIKISRCGFFAWVYSLGKRVSHKNL